MRALYAADFSVSQRRPRARGAGGDDDSDSFGAPSHRVNVLSVTRNGESQDSRRLHGRDGDGEDEDDEDHR